MRKGYLVLEDGHAFEGLRFGSEGCPIGELVFTTGMGGYLETITDPGFAGQIVMQTYPLIGNYGVIGEDLEGSCRMRGYVVREICEKPSNFRTEGDLETYLKEQGIPGICGVDTRELTRILREHGTMNAMICDEIPADLEAVKAYRVSEPLQDQETKVYPAEGEETCKVTLVDYGTKKSVIRQLTQRGCEVTVVSGKTSAEEILAGKPDGVLLSNGAGDPADYPAQVEEVGKLMGKVPVFGAGLGHQLVALSQGAKTVRMKYGRHGANQPVRDLAGTRTYITGQNHNYTVDPETVTVGKVRYQNINDGSCEGIDYPELRAFTVQFQPEGCVDKGTCFIFDRFLDLMKGGNL